MRTPAVFLNAAALMPSVARAFLLAFLAAPPALAQVTVTTDEVIPEANSLRAEVLASTPGSTISVQIGATDDPQSRIDLSSTLSFDNSVTIDNSNTSFGSVAILPPDAGDLFNVQSGVALILRDINLFGNGANTGAEISLATGSSLLIDSERGVQGIISDITGAGSFIKEGSQSLTLSGVNSYTGGTTIRAGDLIGDSLSFANPGMGAIDLAPASGTTARLVFEVNGGDFVDATSPAITHSTGTGTAILSKTGTGTLDLFGPGVSPTEVSIAPTIGLRVEAGELRVGFARAIENRSFIVDSGATLQLSPTGQAPGNTTLPGSFSGAGDLSPNFATSTFTGDLSGFTGSLIVNSIVQIDPAALPSGSLDFDVLLNNLTELSIVGNQTLTLTGNISGPGELRTNGTIATPTRLTGTASHTRGTFVQSGHLIGNTSNLQRTVTIYGNATLEFDQPTNGTFSGTLNGNPATPGVATVIKSGAGALTLANDVNFAGDLEVIGGGLVFGRGADLINAAGNLIVGAGSGGARKSVSIASDFATPGADNDVAIGGNLVFRSDAQLFADLDAASGTATTFSTTGTIDIDTGAVLAVRLQPGNYASGSTFTVLNAGGGFVDAENFTIQESLFFLDIVGAQVGNAYQLMLTSSGTSLGAIGANANQRATGGALDNLITAGPTGDPELQRVLDSLATIQAGEVATVLEEVSADDLAALTNVRLANTARTWRGLSKRLALHRDQAIGHHNTLESRRERARRQRLERRERERARLRRERGTPSVDAGPSNRTSTSVAARPPRSAKPWVAWFEGSGALGELDASDEQKYDYHLVGPIIGADTALTENVRAGFAVAGTHFAYDVKGRSNKGVANSAEGTVYGAYLGEPVEALLGFRYAHSWVDTDRIIKFGAIQDRVESDYEGDEYGLYAEFTRAFGSPRLIRVAPLASVAYTHILWDDINETGTNVLRMNVEGDSLDSALTSIGLRIDAVREMDEGLLFRPRMKALWNHEWADIEREVKGRFAAGGGRLKLEGAETPRDHAEIAVGWEIGYAANANIFVDWSGRFGEDLIENSLSLGVRAAW